MRDTILCRRTGESMNAPRTYTKLRVNPNNEAEVLGQYVGTDGEVSEQLYLVATMSGNPTGRRHAAKLLAASAGIVEAARALLIHRAKNYLDNTISPYRELHEALRLLE